MSEARRNYDAAPAASVLAQSWRSGELLVELPAAIRPQSLEDGYDVQDALIHEIGEDIAGWKLGLGSAIQKRQSGIGRSIAGRILRRFVYGGGDTVTLPNIAPVTVEFEIAYILGRDISPTGEAISATEAISEIRPAFELVLSRFTDRRAVGWPSFAADNGAFQALILGEPIAPNDLDEMVSSLVISAGGQDVAQRLFGEDTTDPLSALGDLIDIARERAMVLPAGSIVSTGTVSQPFNIAKPASHVLARYLGRTLEFRTRIGSGNRRSERGGTV